VKLEDIQIKSVAILEQNIN